jgi:hypothetical protein
MYGDWLDLLYFCLSFAFGEGSLTNDYSTAPAIYRARPLYYNTRGFTEYHYHQIIYISLCRIIAFFNVIFPINTVASVSGRIAMHEIAASDI